MIVTEADLVRDVTPVLRAWLTQEKGQRFNAAGRDLAGHKIYAFGKNLEGGQPTAYVVYEGTEWVWDFMDDEAVDGAIARDGGLAVGGRVYELEAVSSYEMNVTELDPS